MSSRRFIIFAYLCVWLAVCIPKNMTKTQVEPERLPPGSVIQLDTFVGKYHLKRFKGDVLLLPYLDVYGRAVGVTYTDQVININEIGRSPAIESPLGFCILVEQLRRGKYVPEEVDGWYSVKENNRWFQIRMESLRFMTKEQLTAVSVHMQSVYEFDTYLSDFETACWLIDNNKGFILRYNKFYPVYVHTYGEGVLYAFDPVTRNENATIMIKEDGTFEYRSGLLTFVDSEVLVCSEL